MNLQGHAPATPEEAGRIRGLIAQLSEIDAPNFGLSSTMNGHAFLPIPNQRTAGAFRLTDHKLQSSAALRELVTLGPTALPFLLSALDDNTPTKLEIQHESAFGAMWFANELSGNPVNAIEQAVLKARPERTDGLPDEHIRSYTVKVGDVCFVAVGQIVGRPYNAVRYQPTACIVLNSPTHDTQLCREVRAIWSSDDPFRKVFDSLLLDYSTQGIFNGASLDGWDVGSELQTEAALRLLFYFPGESAPLIAKRLTTLNVHQTGPLDAFVKREVQNGVATDDFVKAVAWSDVPLIKKAIADIRERSDDPDVLDAIRNARQ